MKIAKEYTWEMGHRLPFHEGLCKNLHGHTYKMLVSVEGTEDENGLVLDFYELDKVINPLVAQLDHSFMVYEKDTKLLELLNEMESKTFVMKKQTTVENISKMIIEKIQAAGMPQNIHGIYVRVYETVDAYAEAYAKM